VGVLTSSSATQDGRVASVKARHKPKELSPPQRDPCGIKRVSAVPLNVSGLCNDLRYAFFLTHDVVAQPGEVGRVVVRVNAILPLE
jgi:hypothetical protein